MMSSVLCDESDGYMTSDEADDEEKPASTSCSKLPKVDRLCEALLALPVFKQESLESGFQYILSAATSPACKMNEETVTYLNQGQPYELKFKKYGDFSEIKGRTLKSIVRVVFHDRRLQYMEREQLELWRQMRPGERILDIDIPLSYSVQNVKVESNRLNTIEFTWDPAKDTGVFIKVNSISTEFTAKKHGGEKGVPFRVQVETYVLDDGDYRLAHSASCQVKVFKPKGADRKHKTDREKMEKRSEAEKEKYQPSYECTVLAEIPLEQALQYLDNIKQQELKLDSDNVFSREYPFPRGGVARSATHQRAGSDISDNSDNPMTPKQASGSPPLRNFQYIADSSSSENRGDLPKTSSWSSFNGDVTPVNSWVPKIENKKHDTQPSQVNLLSPTASAGQVSHWLKNNRFAGYVSTFSSFSGADLLRLSRDDLIQICGLADGIRLDNALQSKKVRPRLTIYVCQGNHCASSSQQQQQHSSSSGTKKSDSHHGGGNTDGLSNGSGSGCRPMASPGGAMRQLSPSGPNPNPKFTVHRHQDTSPCSSGDHNQSGPSPSSSVGSTSSVKYKRQLVEDLDSEDQDEEKTVTTTKKQRTRTLELSRKEVFHAVFIEQLDVNDLTEKLAGMFSVAVKQIVEIYLVGPNNINVLVTDSVVQNLKDQSRFAIEATLVDNTHDQYKLHMQPME